MLLQLHVMPGPSSPSTFSIAPSTQPHVAPEDAAESLCTARIETIPVLSDMSMLREAIAQTLQRIADMKLPVVRPGFPRLTEAGSRLDDVRRRRENTLAFCHPTLQFRNPVTHQIVAGERLLRCYAQEQGPDGRMEADPLDVCMLFMALVHQHFPAAAGHFIIALMMLEMPEGQDDDYFPFLMCSTQHAPPTLTIYKKPAFDLASTGENLFAHRKDLVCIDPSSPVPFVRLDNCESASHIASRLSGMAIDQAGYLRPIKLVHALEPGDRADAKRRCND